MAVVEKGRRNPAEDSPTKDKPAVEAGESAAGGTPEYTSKAKNKPKLESLRDNWFGIFRRKKD